MVKMKRRQRGRRSNIGEVAVLRDNELIPINGSKACRVINFKEPYFPILFANRGPYW